MVKNLNGNRGGIIQRKNVEGITGALRMGYKKKIEGRWLVCQAVQRRTEGDELPSEHVKPN